VFRLLSEPDLWPGRSINSSAFENWRKHTVMVFPPQHRLSTSSLAPTESGPTDIRPICRTMEPPPRAILWTSGSVEFIRTPAILTNAADCRG
jgi:hypothetical protein